MSDSVENPNQNKEIMKRIRLFLSYLILAPVVVTLLSGNLSVYAQPVRTDYMNSELVAEEMSIQPGRPFWMALRMKMDEHWHVYWRNPGDAAYPTTIQWTLPEGFSAGPIQWPYPQQINLPPLANYAYEGEVYLLTEITPPADLKPGTTVDIGAFGDWLVCEEVCIPGSASYVVSLPVADTPPEANVKWSEGFATARERLPLVDHGWDLAGTVNDSMVVIQASAPDWFAGDLSSIQLFPYDGSLINHFDSQSFGRSGKTYQVAAKVSMLLSAPPERLKGVLVSTDGWRGADSEHAIEFDIPVGATLPTLAVASTGDVDSEISSIWLALAFAFVGGMILNLMPCVLPVLSLKILGFVQQAGEDDSKSWQHGAVFTGGVLVSFLVLAGVLIALRAGGEQLGWGFQLQSPLFVTVISSFLFMFGLSLFGVFEVGTSLIGTGAKLDNRGGMAGSFLSGVTATVVATPCTAPFMGSALGFALIQSASQSLLIFGFLGLGMAFPYLLLSSVPSLLRFVPKPGAWMESFKQFMGFLLMATVVWLVFVIGSQTGVIGMTMLLSLLVCLGIGAWIYGRWGGINSLAGSRLAARAVALIVVAGSLVYTMSILPVAPTGTSSTSRTSATSGGLNWEPFSAQRVEDLREAGRPVFVDFTAAWCLSCQVNERVALHDSEVVEKFEALGITALKADWTSRDPEITRALARFGRNSVPLYVLYTGEAEAEPMILSEILTPGIVLEALESVTPFTTASTR